MNKETTGLVIGVGGGLTVLAILLVILALRKKKKDKYTKIQEELLNVEEPNDKTARCLEASMLTGKPVDQLTMQDAREKMAMGDIVAAEKIKLCLELKTI